MIQNKFTDFMRSLLKGWLTKLETKETKTPRAQRRMWYQLEYHFPPAIVAFTSALFLYFILCYGHELHALQLVAYGVFVAFFTALFSYYLVKDHSSLARNDEAMSLLAVVFFITILITKLIAVFSPRTPYLSPYLTPIGLTSLLVTLLLTPRLAVVLAFVMSMILGFMNNFSLELALTATVGSVTLVAFSQKARTAHHIVRAGFMSGLVQVLMFLFFAVLHQWPINRVLWVQVGSAFMSGHLAVVLALGLLPFLESFFSRVSNLRLIELCDVNHPLLKRMSLEAPGTYHHSLIVASLAEDAANAIGANGLLCRAGAYFHDVGKMVKSEYFIENQGTFGNPHDQVSPSLSKLIITSHVKEGVALAKEAKLDAQIVDFIPQHHGTSKIEYFYHKAVEQESKEEEFEKEDVDAETYRYPGPKPQTKETAIVMLSDSVEAAARTIEEPTHQRFKDLVYKIINKKLFDEQLDETTLTLKDLHIIAERFTTTLQSVYHARIPYPDAATNAKKDIEEELSPPA